jgi:stage V sporulation protein AA
MQAFYTYFLKYRLALNSYPKCRNGDSYEQAKKGLYCGSCGNARFTGWYFLQPYAVKGDRSSERGVCLSMKESAVYIKIEQSMDILNKKIFLRDLGTIYCADKKMEEEIKDMIFYTISAKESQKYIFSVMKVVELIEKRYPQALVINLGEKDFVVKYVPPKEKPPKAWEWLKSFFVGVVAFFGAAFSIMTFNTDVSVPEVFGKIYFLVTGEVRTDGTVVELGYCIGLGLGILLFFNHFSRKKIEVDPTPIQIQMRSYEKDINEALIKNAEREGKNIDIS